MKKRRILHAKVVIDNKSVCPVALAKAGQYPYFRARMQESAKAAIVLLFDRPSPIDYARDITDNDIFGRFVISIQFYFHARTVTKPL
jgi:hypothetical protein